MSNTHTTPPSVGAIVDYDGPCATRSGDYVVAGSVVDGEVGLTCTVCNDLVYADINRVTVRT